MKKKKLLLSLSLSLMSFVSLVTEVTLKEVTDLQELVKKGESCKQAFSAAKKGRISSDGKLCFQSYLLLALLVQKQQYEKECCDMARKAINSNKERLDVQWCAFKIIYEYYSNHPGEHSKVHNIANQALNVDMHEIKSVGLDIYAQLLRNDYLMYADKAEEAAKINRFSVNESCRESAYCVYFYLSQKGKIDNSKTLSIAIQGSIDLSEDVRRWSYLLFSTLVSNGYGLKEAKGVARAALARDEQSSSLSILLKELAMVS